MRCTYLIVSVLLLSGCGGGDMQDLEEFVKNAGSDMRGKIAPPPEVRRYEPFYYENDGGIPDPFKPRKKESKGGGANQPDVNRPREALEEFPLENLRMVGYLFRDKIPYAVIRAPDGKLHRIKVGNYLGQNFGKIQAISDVEITILEKVQDSNGDWADRVSSLQLLE